MTCCCAFCDFWGRKPNTKYGFCFYWIKQTNEDDTCSGFNGRAREIVP